MENGRLVPCRRRPPREPAGQLALLRDAADLSIEHSKPEKRQIKIYSNTLT